MKISKVKIKNFRLLKDLSIDIEDKLTLVLGKNNCGKTSLLLVLDKFLNGKSFSYDDFNLEFRASLEQQIDDEWTAGDKELQGISLKIFITYDENDDLSAVGNTVLMDLNPENKTIVLRFDYNLSKAKFENLQRDYQAQSKLTFAQFFEINYWRYFSLTKRSVLFDVGTSEENDEVFTEIKEKSIIDAIIQFKKIDARRLVSNENSDKNLSTQSAKIFSALEQGEGSDAVTELNETLVATDGEFDKVYAKIFSEVINDVKTFGGIKLDESNIKIMSSLQNKDFLANNTKVVYEANSEQFLPENHNGLGYLNLINMIFELRILINEFTGDPKKRPADINLLFIEEPEAHTHPQMQRIFIKNIKTIIGAGIKQGDIVVRDLQTIISTHSSHIVADSDFDDIKYLKKEGGQIVSKNLRDLEKQYERHPDYFKFLKQYLTLNRSELFFADKAIFIEGDTERILLPAMMRKLDVEAKDNSLLPLQSQNISIVEVGAHAHVFKAFIEFVGLKSLVVTDIDSIGDVFDKNGNKKPKPGACRVKDGTKTSNSALKSFFPGHGDTLDYFKNLTDDKKCIDGVLRFAYQTEEEGYHARSFEDAFFHINKEFIKGKSHPEGKFNEDAFPNVNPKTLKTFCGAQPWDAYEVAAAVGSKPSFAMEILLNSDKDFSNWHIPAYIKEGLTWLQAD
jgi:putative ATP-dependent endonuclease of OLD family